MDPQASSQFSQLGDLLVAIMKEVKVVQQADQSDHKYKSRKGSLRRIENIFVETSIEIFKLSEKQPLLGAVCDNRKVDSQFSPKNISTFHRPEQSGIDKQKPVNCDFNFCGWYIVDELNHNVNFSFLIDKLQVNMRTPYNLDPQVVPPEEMQSHIIFSKNATADEGCLDEKDKFLADFEIAQGMPVYRVDFQNPLNLSRLESYRNAFLAAKQTWRRELTYREAQALIENAEGINLNLGFETRSMYIIVSQASEGLKFESLYPIVPDFFWQTAEGQSLRNEVLANLARNFRPPLLHFEEQEPNKEIKFKLIKNGLAQTIDYDQVYPGKSPAFEDKFRFATYENRFDARVLA